MILPAKHAKEREVRFSFRVISHISRVAVLLFTQNVFADATFVGAPPPIQPLKQSPLSPEAELATFRVPPGFKVELVAAEPDGGKFVTVAFDHAGRMWTMTAFEYPLDANEAPAEAKALIIKWREQGRALHKIEEFCRGSNAIESAAFKVAKRTREAFEQCADDLDLAFGRIS